MGTESYTPLDKVATLEDWTDGKRWNVILQTSFEGRITGTDKIPEYLVTTPNVSSTDPVLVTRFSSSNAPLGPGTPFKFMPKNGQIYGEIEVTLEDGSTAPMVFIISMVFMQNDEDPEDVERYLSSITLINDPETAGVMGAEEGGIVPSSSSGS